MVLIWTLFMQIACIKQSAPLTFSKTQDISFAAILDDSDSSEYSALPEEILVELGEYVDRHNVRFEVLTGETNLQSKQTEQRLQHFSQRPLILFESTVTYQTQLQLSLIHI